MNAIGKQNEQEVTEETENLLAPFSLFPSVQKMRIAIVESQVSFRAIAVDEPGAWGRSFAEKLTLWRAAARAVRN
jgi:hypothetical protein